MCVKQVYKSPINYTGNKYRLLPQFIKLFPKKVNVCVDLFTGGSTIAINLIANKVVAIDKNEKVIELLRFLSIQEYEKFILQIDLTLEKYNLSNSYKYGYSYYKDYVIGNNGLKEYNKIGYKKLREDYNNIKNKKSSKANLLLYILIMYSFNNDIRFNSKNEFNLPIGKTDMNKNNREKLKNYIDSCKDKNIEFITKDFSKIDNNFFENVDFVYVDPPYLITTAVYNENAGWNAEAEKKLLNLLDYLDSKNIKFALSNILEKTKTNVRNEILYSWIKSNSDKYFVHNIEYNYKSASYNKKNRDCLEKEILVTNYKLEE